MRDIFAEIKSTLPITAALHTYGIALTRHNKVLCPFHREKTPSMVIYPNTNSFHCFGCGTGGSVIDFVSRLFGLEPLAAALKINEDFSLGIACGQALSDAQKREYKARSDKETAVISAFECWHNSYTEYVKRRLVALHNLLRVEKKLTFIDYNRGMQAMASGDYTEIHLLEYEYKILVNGTAEEQVNLYVERTKDGEAV